MGDEVNYGVDYNLFICVWIVGKSDWDKTWDGSRLLIRSELMGKEMVFWKT